jgi:hypothetical protein
MSHLCHVIFQAWEITRHPDVKIFGCENFHILVTSEDMESAADTTYSLLHKHICEMLENDVSGRKVLSAGGDFLPNAFTNAL